MLHNGAVDRRLRRRVRRRCPIRSLFAGVLDRSPANWSFTLRWASGMVRHGWETPVSMRSSPSGRSGGRGCPMGVIGTRHTVTLQLQSRFGATGGVQRTLGAPGSLRCTPGAISTPHTVITLCIRVGGLAKNPPENFVEGNMSNLRVYRFCRGFWRARRCGEGRRARRPEPSRNRGESFPDSETLTR